VGARVPNEARIQRESDNGKKSTSRRTPGRGRARPTRPANAKQHHRFKRRSIPLAKARATTPTYRQHVHPREIPLQYCTPHKPASIPSSASRPTNTPLSSHRPPPQRHLHPLRRPLPRARYVMSTPTPLPSTAQSQPDPLWEELECSHQPHSTAPKLMKNEQH
jgi:hypothetical protein